MAWRILITALAALAPALPGQAQPVGACTVAYYAQAVTIPPGDNRTVAKVYDLGGRSESDFRGNAFVVDGPQGLVVSAKHVVANAVEKAFGNAIVGAKVDLVFNDFEGGTNVETSATVVAVLGDKIESPRENHPRDLALLQVDMEELRFKLREHRMAIGVATREFRNANVQSFFGNGPLLIEDTGSFVPESFAADSSPMQCTYRFAFKSDGGDSGAILTDIQKAVTLGVLINRAPDKKSWGVVLPASCMREPLVTWMDRHFDAKVADTVNFLLTADQTQLALRLRSTDDPERPTNAVLHAAIRRISAFTDEDRTRWQTDEKHVQFLNRRYCVIDNALLGREAALPLVERGNFESAWSNLTRKIASANPASAGDELYEQAEALRASDPKRSREMAILASVVYADTIGLDVQTDSLASNSLPEFIADSAILEAALDSDAQADVARRFKGISDSLMLAASLSEDSSYRTVALATARGAALQAVWLANEKAPAIASNSLIAYSDASSTLGDWDAATVGYIAAIRTPGLEPLVAARALSDLGYVAGRAENVSTITETGRLRNIIETTVVPDRLLLGGANASGVTPVLPASTLGRPITIQPSVRTNLGVFR